MSKSDLIKEHLVSTLINSITILTTQISTRAWMALSNYYFKKNKKQPETLTRLSSCSVYMAEQNKLYMCQMCEAMSSFLILVMGTVYMCQTPGCGPGIWPYKWFAKDQANHCCIKIPNIWIWYWIILFIFILICSWNAPNIKISNAKLWP